MKRMIAGLALIMLGTTYAAAADIKVLSAGAVEPGLHKAVEQFKRATGHDVAIQFNTAPQIAQRMQDGYVADVLIARRHQLSSSNSMRAGCSLTDRSYSARSASA
jgi:ABC-type molybdate transport system substrate-binding protein